MNKFVRLGFVPRHYDLGLLVLRLLFGFVLCILHGWPKVMNFSQMSGHFPDPLHIGSNFTLLFAILSDLICSLLIAIDSVGGDYRCGEYRGSIHRRS
jgi:uncharacterized membrane protein YphA (DoxX/SURF4 family)